VILLAARRTTTVVYRIPHPFMIRHASSLVLGDALSPLVSIA